MSIVFTLYPELLPELRVVVAECADEVTATMLSCATKEAYHGPLSRFRRPTHRLLSLLHRWGKRFSPLFKELETYWVLPCFSQVRPPKRYDAEAADKQREVLDGHHATNYQAASQWEFKRQVWSATGPNSRPTSRIRLCFYLVDQFKSSAVIGHQRPLHIIDLLPHLRLYPGIVEMEKPPALVYLLYCLLRLGDMDRAHALLVQRSWELARYAAQQFISLAALVSHHDKGRVLDWLVRHSGVDKEDRYDVALLAIDTADVAWLPAIGQQGLVAWLSIMEKEFRPLKGQTWYLPPPLASLAADAPMGVRQRLVNLNLMPQPRSGIDFYEHAFEPTRTLIQEAIKKEKDKRWHY